MLFILDTVSKKITIDLDNKTSLADDAQALALLNRGAYLNDIKNAILNIGLLDDTMFTKTKNFLEVFVAMDQRIMDDQAKSQMMLDMLMQNQESENQSEDDLDELLIPPTQSFSPSDN